MDFAAVARTAAGASGAELANIVNEAALRAVRRGSKVTMQEDLEESVETVIAGYQKKNRILSTKEKLTVAYHEIGHALVAAKTDGFRAGSENYHYSTYIRCVGIHHAGR